jgi:hypothetical protein
VLAVTTVIVGRAIPIRARRSFRIWRGFARHCQPLGGDNESPPFRFCASGGRPRMSDQRPHELPLDERHIRLRCLELAVQSADHLRGDSEPYARALSYQPTAAEIMRRAGAFAAFVVSGPLSGVAPAPPPARHGSSGNG